MNKMVKEKINLDEVLDKFSMFGRYHLQFMLYAVYAFASSSIVSTTYVFVAEETEYRCANEAFNNNTCGTVNSESCSDWIYDNPDSFVAEFDIACQNWKRTLLGTAHIFGYMIGLFIVGPLSDKMGRKKIIILEGSLCAIIGIAKSFSQSYWMYVFFEFLGSMVGDVYSPLYVLNLEIVSAKKRVVYHFICGLGSTLGAILVPTAAWAFPYWRHFLRIVYLPSLLIFFGSWLIDDSPRWLLTQGKNEKAIAIIEKMSDKSNTRINKETLNNIAVDLDESKSVAFLELLKITFKSRALLKRFLVCVVWWMTSTFVFYGTLINSVSLQGNKYINYALISITDLPGSLIIMYLLTKYKRRYPLMYSFFSAAVLYFIHPLLPKDIAWLSVTIYMVSRMMSMFFFHVTYIYTSELFPTYTRNSMHAMCSALGRIGGMIAPQTPLLLVYWSGLPTLLFASASLVAGLVTFLVPDTADVSLPDTVAQAELIGIPKKHKRNIAGIDNPAMKEANEKIDSIL